MVESGNEKKIVKAQRGKAESASAQVNIPVIEIPKAVSVRDLAQIMNVNPLDAIKQLMRKGIMANINQVLDYESASNIAEAFGYGVRRKPETGDKISRISEIRKQKQLAGKSGGLKSRPPVVTIMGHVDHGKTRLLDAIRQTNVMATEAGNITQHIGAYQVDIEGQKITFLDTPGHEAFTEMRARGAQVTDITVLVVAADDGVMPQTKEAIDHAKAAGVPIVVAINKIDKPDANLDLVKQQLAEAGLVVEEWGGDTIAVEVSAKEKKNIPALLENLMLVAEMEDFKADPSRPAEGVIIEAEMDKSKGALATVLINSGTLRVGDTVVVGETSCRVKAMFNDKGKRVKKAEPAMPVEILGLDSVPNVGDILTAVSSDKQAHTLIEKYKQEKNRGSAAANKVNLSNIYNQISSGNVKELNIIVKADVQGSIEPIYTSLNQLSTDEAKVRIIHSGSGNVTESDVMLASASKGIIIGFNNDYEAGARHLAEREGVSTRFYSVIYNLIDDVSKALAGLLEPEMVEVVEGRAEVRAVFTAGRKNKAAGVYVTEGKISRGSDVRVLRKGEVVAESSVSSLKRFKDDAKEVATGYECGVGLKDYHDFEEGDILEFYRIEESR